MRKHVRSFGLFLFVLCLLFVPMVRATIFGNIRGIVHDPQHRPIAGVEITLKSATSAWTQTTQTNPDGEFHFDAVATRRVFDYHPSSRLSRRLRKSCAHFRQLALVAL